VDGRRRIQPVLCVPAEPVVDPASSLAETLEMTEELFAKASEAPTVPVAASAEVCVRLFSSPRRRADLVGRGSRCVLVSVSVQRPVLHRPTRRQKRLARLWVGAEPEGHSQGLPRSIRCSCALVSFAMSSFPDHVAPYSQSILGDCVLEPAPEQSGFSSTEMLLASGERLVVDCTPEAGM
jgi:hypothetical protein